MRYTVAVFSAFVFIFMNFNLAMPDELSDLKKQFEVLQKKIEDLEKRQQDQAKSVEKIQKQPSAYEVVTEQLKKQVNVGGHFKFFLGDQSYGEVNDDSQHNSFAAGINNAWLYFSKNLTDYLQITVAPVITVQASATPSLGSNITRSNSSDVNIDIDEAYMTLRLPYQFEVKAGAIYPLFSEEYGTKSWWHEQYHGNQGLLNLQVWKSTGIEIYRNFDFESFSLPVYLYPFLNGYDRGPSYNYNYTDNNSAKNMLLHITPEFLAFGSKMRFLGSAGFGRWDNDGNNNAYQWAGGADFSRSGFSLSGEYMYRWNQDLPLTNGGSKDGEDKGWYIKAKYALNPQWKFLLKYSDVDLWATGTDNLLTDHYQTWCLAVDYNIAESSTIIPQVEYVNADQQGSDETLRYWRYTLGWRTTF
jgi:hypothetical protein